MKLSLILCVAAAIAAFCVEETDAGLIKRMAESQGQDTQSQDSQDQDTQDQDSQGQEGQGQDSQGQEGQESQERQEFAAKEMEEAKAVDDAVVNSKSPNYSFCENRKSSECESFTDQYGTSVACVSNCANKCHKHTKFTNRPDEQPQQDTTAAPQEQDSTAAPQEQDSTAAPQEQDTTAAPQEQDSTAAPQEQDSTAAPQEQDSTAAPQEQDSTAAPQEAPLLGLRRPSKIIVMLKQDSTAAPQEQDSTAAPQEETIVVEEEAPQEAPICGAYSGSDIIEGNPFGLPPLPGNGGASATKLAGEAPICGANGGSDFIEGNPFGLPPLLGNGGATATQKPKCKCACCCYNKNSCETNSQCSDGKCVVDTNSENIKDCEKLCSCKKTS